MRISLIWQYFKNFYNFLKISTRFLHNILYFTKCSKILFKIYVKFPESFPIDSLLLLLLFQNFPQLSVDFRNPFSIPTKLYLKFSGKFIFMKTDSKSH